MSNRADLEETIPVTSGNGRPCALVHGWQCGSAQMPLTTNGATLASAAALTTVDTWIMCGAPNN